MTSQLPVDEQLDAFREALSRNEVLTEVLSRSASLGLPGWYLTAGCLFQTVWNLWYHDHAMGITRVNVYAGLAGMLLLRDEFDTGTPGDRLGLPAGEFEVPLVLQEKLFTDDGHQSVRSTPIVPEGGVVGDIGVVNDKIWPYLHHARRASDPPAPGHFSDPRSRAAAHHRLPAGRPPAADRGEMGAVGGRIPGRADGAAAAVRIGPQGTSCGSTGITAPSTPTVSPTTCGDTSGTAICSTTRTTT